MIQWTTKMISKVTAGKMISVALKSTATRYELLNGTLPNGVSLSSSGLLSGKTAPTAHEVDYPFTVRAFLGDAFSDRYFVLSVGPSKPLEFTRGGFLASVKDSEYVSLKIPISNPSNQRVSLQLVSGKLPPGLFIDGLKISGYPEKPFNELTKTFEKQNYIFTLAADTDTARVTMKFSIEVGESLVRLPVIANINRISNSGFLPFELQTPYLGDFASGDLISFKVIGVDFDNQPIEYVVTKNTMGLSVDPETGWITGRVTTTENTIRQHTISVYVRRKFLPSQRSKDFTLVFTVNNNVPVAIEWPASRDIELSVNQPSTLSIAAQSKLDLKYSIKSGSLPPQLTMNEFGQILGKTSFNRTNPDETYVFEVLAQSRLFPWIQSTTSFTIQIINQTTPINDVYFDLLLTKTERRIVNQIRTDSVINNNLFRTLDPNFNQILRRVDFLRNVNAASFEKFQNALGSCSSFNLVLGELKIAYTSNYEVVYYDVTSSNLAHTDLKNKIALDIGVNPNSFLLPEWMRVQQPDSTVIGDRPSIIVAIVKPGQGSNVFEYFKRTYDNLMRSLAIGVDRVCVDSSTSFDYNSRVSVPYWTTTPSKVYQNNTKDFVVYLKS